MVTIHSGADGTAVLVDGGILAAVGPFEELRAAHPGARVRTWPGVLRPGLTHEGELPPAPTPRERVHALLLRGVTAVAGAPADPALRSTLDRYGLLPARRAPALEPGARADFAVFEEQGRCLATVVAGRLLHRRA
ncbi:imidazolonepropionase-like domain-containing protein [Actinacidiphila sp. bgisy167]|uniref:imidazolonepropionase-like domain-containing protein n=1 Tax=Actinacidiphila sp. bgisy167 TaxID=3413797 RepID=UPI003D74798A